MKRTLIQFFAVFLTAALLLPLAGCAKGSGVNSFTWFVDEIPANLDPQIATSSEDVIACTNLYSGLVRLDSDGEPQNELCEDWSVSSNGLTYTFHLKSGLAYQAAGGEATDYAITAEDFVYAFQRMFSPETQSPYAVEFSAIEGADSALAGLTSPEQIGVKATDSLTLVFTLSEPDDDFVTKLALPGAMPCDKDFFLSTGGSYGLTSDTTLSSGPFYLYNWTSSGLFLRREGGDGLVDSLRLVQNTGTAQSAQDLILNERCTAALDTTNASTTLRSISYSDTTWCLLFNTQNTALASTQLRQALASGAQQAMPLSVDASIYAPATGLVPDGLSVGSVDYRETAGDPTPSLGSAYALYRDARQTVSSQDLMGITILVPKDSGLTQAVEAINSVWQRELSLFFSVEEAEAEDFAQRLAEGDYTIALVPVTAESNSVYGLLSQFSPEGLTRYDNPHFAALLDQSLNATGAARCALLAQAEAQLVDDCALLPLFAQQKRLLIADGVEGLVFDPYGPLLDLTYTTRE